MLFKSHWFIEVQKFQIITLTLIYLTVSNVAFAQNIQKGKWIECGKATIKNQQTRNLGSSDSIYTIMQNAFVLDAFNMPAEALAAVKYSLHHWSELITSSKKIKIKVIWELIEGNFLARTQPTEYFREFSKSALESTWYPVALAEKISKQEMNDSNAYEIEIRLNEEANWYIGIDGSPPNDKYDLVSVLLHEIAHGLGFISSAYKVEAGLQFSSDPYVSIYDHSLIDSDGNRLYKYNYDPTLLYALTTNEEVFIYSPDKYQIALYKCYAPNIFFPGISLSHFDDTYADENLLMSPFIPSGWALHKIDSITSKILMNMGWQGQNQNEISIYPNPTRDFLEIRLPSNLDKIQIEIFTLNGNKINTQRIIDPLTPIYKIQTPYPDGIYLIYFQNKNLHIKRFFKIIIRH